MPQKWFSALGDGQIFVAIAMIAKSTAHHFRQISMSRWLDQAMGAVFTTIAISVVGWMLSIPATLRQVESIAVDATKLRGDVNQIMQERRNRSVEIDRSQANQDKRLDRLELEHQQMAEKCSLACRKKR